VANTDVASTIGTTAVLIDVIANDEDCDNNLNPGSVNTNCSVCSDPADGTIVIDPITGAVTYTPDAGFSGTDYFIYQICDNGTPALCDTAIVYINVASLNTPPLVGDSTVTVQLDELAEVCVLFQDLEGNGPFTVSLDCMDNGQATATIVGNTVCISYLPDAGFVGSDTICITLCDSEGDCGEGQVVVTVLPEEVSSVLGIAKAVSAEYPMDGKIILTYTIVAQNIGNDTLNSVQVIDDLEANLPSSVVYSLVSIPTATGTLVINPSYNGNSDVNLLDSASSYLLPGQSDTIVILINITVVGNGTQTIGNIAYGTAYGSGGAFTEDLSDEGESSDPNGNGDPGGDDENDPTVIVIASFNLRIPGGFSPNDDGYNDLFEIPGLEEYLGNHLMIFNRWGNKVYEQTNYDGSWNGIPNVRGTVVGQEKVPAGTYYFILDLNRLNVKPITGYITIQY
jgi:gliding motility-associated-like protein/uncharacterized repeat protein (TIGR01451 family)